MVNSSLKRRIAIKAAAVNRVFLEQGKFIKECQHRPVLWYTFMNMLFHGKMRIPIKFSRFSDDVVRKGIPCRRIIEVIETIPIEKIEPTGEIQGSSILTVYKRQHYRFTSKNASPTTYSITKRKIRGVVELNTIMSIIGGRTVPTYSKHIVASSSSRKNALFRRNSFGMTNDDHKPLRNVRNIYA